MLCFAISREIKLLHSYTTAQRVSIFVTQQNNHLQPVAVPFVNSTMTQTRAVKMQPTSRE